MLVKAGIFDERERQFSLKAFKVKKKDPAVSRFITDCRAFMSTHVGNFENPPKTGQRRGGSVITWSSAGAGGMEKANRHGLLRKGTF